MYQKIVEGIACLNFLILMIFGRCRYFFQKKMSEKIFLQRGHPQTTWFSNWNFLTPPPPLVDAFQIANVVFSRTFLDPPSPLGCLFGLWMTPKFLPPRRWIWTRRCSRSRTSCWTATPSRKPQSCWFRLGPVKGKKLRFGSSTKQRRLWILALNRV